MTYGKHFIHQHVPQNQPLPGRAAEMQRNAAGGYGFIADEWRRLNRFLMIGTEGGTYYESERELTLANAQAVQRCIAQSAVRVVDEVVRVSVGGLAPSNSPAIFVLALVVTLGNVEERQYALSKLDQVCRIGTHLFELVATLKALRHSTSMGRALRKAVGGWYTHRDERDLALQLIKYRSRFDWTHRDLLRVAHVQPESTIHEWLLGWAAGKRVVEGDLPDDARRLIYAFEQAQHATTAQEIVALIADHNLPREALPTRFLNDKAVWDALLAKMPYTATLRNLNKLTVVGLFEPFNAATQLVTNRLLNPQAIRGARVHPLDLLIALKTYAHGRGLKGSLKWTPNQAIVAALNDAFYLAFANVEPVQQNILVALDVSGSMRGTHVAGVPGLTALEAGAATLMVYLQAQPNAHLIAFDTSIFADLRVSPSMRLDQVLEVVSKLGGGGTNCALPFSHARAQHWRVDGFLTVTDSESWQGNTHAVTELEEYRQRVQFARHVNVQTTAMATRLQDPQDQAAFEMAGFSPALFSLANAFFKGEL